MQRARPSIVALTIAKHAPIFTLLCFPPAIWAGVEGEWPFAASLICPALLALLIYAGTYAKPLPDDLRGVEALVSVAIVFVLSALITVPAFMQLDMPPLDALFEAMSGATTTGLSVARSPDDWPMAGHALRAWLQWCGGLVMATAVLALLLPSGVPTRRLGQAGIDQGDRIASTRKQARQLLSVYIGITVIMSALTALAVPDWREGVLLTLSAVSTAGFAPRSDSLASYSALGQGLVILSCTLGAISLLTFVLILQGKVREAWSLGSAKRVLKAVVVFSALYALLLIASGTIEPAQIYGEVLNLLSGLTTAGFATGPMPAAGPALLLLVIAMLAGGDVGSTAGGLKLARVALLGRAIAHALRRPRLPPQAVAPLRQDGEPVESNTILAVLALVSLYVVALLAVWMHFLARGYPALPALFETVSTLSTVGLSTGIVSADLPADLKITLTFAMWLGRLEFIAVLLLLSPATWMKRRF